MKEDQKILMLKFATEIRTVKMRIEPDISMAFVARVEREQEVTSEEAFWLSACVLVLDSCFL